MDDPKIPFEIIEDEPPKLKRKRKRKSQPIFGDMPWRPLGAAFLVGVLITGSLIAGFILLTQSQTKFTATMPPAQEQTAAPTNIPALTFGMNQWTNGALAWIGRDSMTVFGTSKVPYINLTYVPQVDTVAVSPDEKQVVGLTSEYLSNEKLGLNRLVFWDSASGQIERTVQAHDDPQGMIYFGAIANALAYTADGSLVASGAKDGKINIWNSQTGELRASLPIQGAAGTLALKFTSDNRLAAVVRFAQNYNFDHDALIVWDVQDLDHPRQVLQSTLSPLETTQAIFSPDGKYLGLKGVFVTGFAIWSVATGQELGELSANGVGEIQDIAFSPVDNIMAIAYRWSEKATPRPNQPAGARVEMRIVRWKSENQALQTETLNFKEDYIRLGFDIKSLTFRPDGKGLDFVTFPDNVLTYWNIETGETTTAPIR